LAKQSLLVADADPRSLRVLDAGLRHAGFAVTTAADGGEALRAIQRAAPDLVLCELSLPPPDGAVLCRAVRADERTAGLPFLLMSTDSAPQTRARALGAGADDLLLKPIEIQDLVGRIQAMLARSEQRQLAQRGGAGLTGAVDELGLVDLFQSLESWKRTGRVICEQDGKRAEVWVRDGEIVDAQSGSVSGEAAFYRLLRWKRGSFRVEFGPVQREARIEPGTQRLILEAMRRVDELGRVFESLDPGSVPRVDFDALAGRLAELPDEVNPVVRAVDGVRTVAELIEVAALDELTAAGIVRRLFEAGVLQHANGARAFKDPAAVAPLRLVRFPPLRGARRERLRREMEQAREALRSGAPIRLAHVVELPRFPAGARAARREISPAVSEAAKRFAPDLPVAALDGLEVDRVPTPVSSPAAELEDAVAPAPWAFLELSGLPPEAPRAEQQGPDREAASAVTQDLKTTAAPGAVAPKAMGGRRAAAARPPWPLVASGAAALLAIALAWSFWPRPRTDRVPAGTTSAAAPKPSPPAGSVAEPREAAGMPIRADAQPSPSARPPTVEGSSSKPPADEYQRSLASGTSLLRRHRYKAAAVEFRRAVAVNPKSVPALLALGDAHLQADQAAEALKPLEAAARLDPRSGRAQFLLGSAYQGLARNSDAARAYGRYLQLEPSGEFAAEARSILRNLRR
jgi:DNA-binding response OmpR family regulator